MEKHLESEQWIDIESMKPFGEGESWLVLEIVQNPSTYFQGQQI